MADGGSGDQGLEALGDFRIDEVAERDGSSFSTVVQKVVHPRALLSVEPTYMRGMADAIGHAVEHVGCLSRHLHGELVELAARHISVVAEENDDRPVLVFRRMRQKTKNWTVVPVVEPALQRHEVVELGHGWSLLRISLDNCGTKLDKSQIYALSPLIFEPIAKYGSFPILFDIPSRRVTLNPKHPL